METVMRSLPTAAHTEGRLASGKAQTPGDAEIAFMAALTGAMGAAPQADSTPGLVGLGDSASIGEGETSPDPSLVDTQGLPLAEAERVGPLSASAAVLATLGGVRSAGGEALNAHRLNPRGAQLALMRGLPQEASLEVEPLRQAAGRSRVVDRLMGPGLASESSPIAGQGLLGGAPQGLSAPITGLAAGLTGKLAPIEPTPGAAEGEAAGSAAPLPGAEGGAEGGTGSQRAGAQPTPGQSLPSQTRAQAAEVALEAISETLAAGQADGSEELEDAESADAGAESAEAEGEGAEAGSAEEGGRGVSLKGLALAPMAGGARPGLIRSLARRSAPARMALEGSVGRALQPPGGLRSRRGASATPVGAEAAMATPTSTTAPGLAPSAAAPTPTLPPEVTPDDVLRQITDGLRPGADGESGEAEIELNPIELGRVKVKLSVEGDAVRVLMLTEHAAVRDLALTHQQELEAALLAQGLQTTGFDVQQEGARQEGQPPMESTGGRSAEADEEAAPKPNITRAAPRGALDLTV